MLYHSGPSSLVFFAEWLKIIMDSDLQIIEVQLKPKLHQLWRIALWLGKLQLWVFLKKVWVFYLKSVVHALVINKLNSLWTVLLLPLCEQIACFVPTVKPTLIRPVNSHCSDQQELASGSDAQRVLWNGTPKCFVYKHFPSPQLPTRPKACSQARGEPVGYFTIVAEDLNSGLPRKNPAGGQGG